MAQWNALRDLVKEEKIKPNNLAILYGGRKKFPVQFREKYASWIEAQDWNCEASDDLSKKKYDDFVNILQNDHASMAPSMKKIDFHGALEDFTDQYEGRHDEFVKVINNILKTENTLILSSQEPSDSDDPRFEIAQENAFITQKINALRAKLRSTENDLSRLEEGQEKNYLELQEQQEKMAQQKKQLDSDPEAHTRMQKLQAEQMACIQKLNQRRMETTNALCLAYQDLLELLGLVWKELEMWHEDQRLACTKLTKPKEQIMEVLDKMGESIGEVFMSVVQQVDKLTVVLEKVPFRDDPQLKHMKENIKPKVLESLRQHLNRVFIVDKNIPKQVLKVTNGKSLGFSMSVRFLGGHAFGLNVNQPKVSVKLYPEKQIDEVKNNVNPLPDGCCKIQNGQDKSFEFLRSGNCMANFNNMVVSNVKREGRGRNDDFVTDYKHAFIFETNIRIMADSFRLKAMSLPLVITSQTSQECMARGTIIWSAAFLKTKDRALPFEAEEEVQWVKVAEVINALFKEYTSRALNKEHLNYLAKIAFREPNNLEFEKMSISRSNILKDKLPKKDFPFWKWLMSCLNSVKDTLLAEWKEGLIYGFISKDDAEIKLRSQASGTFLIRFSESNIEQGQRADIHGYLTVAVAEVHPNTGALTVFHVKESLTPKDLQEKRLAPILEAYETDDYTVSGEGKKASKKLLINLWTPQKLVRFEEAFGKYIKQKENMNDGYNRGRYLIKIYLADASNPDRHNWPMSPGSSTAAAPSPAPSDMFSDYPGSPGGSELNFGLPPLSALSASINLPSGPLGGNNPACVMVNPISHVSPGVSVQSTYPNYPGPGVSPLAHGMTTSQAQILPMQQQQPQMQQHQQMQQVLQQQQQQLQQQHVGDANIPPADMSMTEIQDLMSTIGVNFNDGTVDQQFVHMTQDDDVMLTEDQSAAQFTTLQNVQYAQQPQHQQQQQQRQQ